MIMSRRFRTRAFVCATLCALVDWNWQSTKHSSQSNQCQVTALSIEEIIEPSPVPGATHIDHDNWKSIATPDPIATPTSTAAASTPTVTVAASHHIDAPIASPVASQHSHSQWLDLASIPRWPQMFERTCKQSQQSITKQQQHIFAQWLASHPPSPEFIAPSSAAASSSSSASSTSSTANKLKSVQLAPACRASNADRNKHFFPIAARNLKHNHSPEELMLIASRIRIVGPRIDITSLSSIDVLVNAANSQLSHGSGVCDALFRADGVEEMTQACRLVIRNKAQRKGVKSTHPKAQIQTSQTAITPAHLLTQQRVNYVFHSVGPKLTVAQQGKPTPRQQRQLRATYWEALDKAVLRKQSSIAFPCISTHAYRFNQQYAAHTALAAIRDWFMSKSGNRNQIQAIVLVLYTQEDYRLYLRNLPLYFPVPLLRDSKSRADNLHQDVQIKTSWPFAIARPSPTPPPVQRPAASAFKKSQLRSLTIYNDQHVIVSALDPLAPLPKIRRDPSNHNAFRSWAFTVTMPNNRIDWSHLPLSFSSLQSLCQMLYVAHSIQRYVAEILYKSVYFTAIRYYWHEMRLLFDTDRDSGIALLTVYGPGHIEDARRDKVFFSPESLMSHASVSKSELTTTTTQHRLNEILEDVLLRAVRDSIDTGVHDAMHQYKTQWGVA